MNLHLPALMVTSTSAQDACDPLETSLDSRVLHIKVDYLPSLASPTPLELGMLIPQSGIGQP